MARAPLAALLVRHPTMPSDAVLAMLAERGACSKVNLTGEGPVEAGIEESSRAIGVELDLAGDDQVEVKDDSGSVTREKVKKRTRKDVPPRPYHHKRRPLLLVGC